VTDQSGAAKTGTVDSLERVTTLVEDPTGKNYTTTYVYDPLGNLTTVTQGAQTRQFGYDSLSRLVSRQNPEQVGATTYAYDANSNVHQKTDPNGVTTTYGYDALNRLSSKTYGLDPTPAVAYAYDSSQTVNGVGRLASATTSDPVTGNAIVF